MSASVWNILDLLDEAGEHEVSGILNGFSCTVLCNGQKVSLNQDIEFFLRHNAIQFARQKSSVTYLVGDDDGAMLGYFTLAHKAICISATGLSQTVKRMISRYAKLDEKTDSYTVSSFLIAQIGKNYAVDNGQRISGHKLMQLAEDELAAMQRRIGGGIQYLDCEANAKLIRFYEQEGFRLFGERISERDGRRYLQYLKYF